MQEKKIVVSYQDVKALYKKLGLEEPDKFAQKAIKNNFKTWGKQDWATESCEALVRRTGKTTYEVICTLARYKAMKKPILIRGLNMGVAKNVEKTMKEIAKKLRLKPEITVAPSMNQTYLVGFAGIIHTDHTARPL